jgi:protein TonB
MSPIFQDADSAAAESTERSVALIGPNESSRRTVARALAGSDAGFVREFAAYPGRLSEVPRIVAQNFTVMMIDVDSDESYALELVEALAKQSSATVMAYSVRNDPELMMRCMRAGARDFLPLPADEPADAAPAKEDRPAQRPQLTIVESPAPAEETMEIEAHAAPRTPEIEETPEPAEIQYSFETLVAAKAAPVPDKPAPARPAPVVAAPAAAASVSEPDVPVTAGIRFSEFPDEEEEARSKRDSGKWKWFAAVPVIAALGLAAFFLRPTRPADSAPAPTALSEPATVQPAVPENTSSVPATKPATPIAKPTAGSPGAHASTAAQSPAASAHATQVPPAVAPDAMNAQLATPARFGSDIKKPAAPDEAPPAGFAPGALPGGGSLPSSVFAQHGGVEVRPGVTAVSAGVAAGSLIQHSPPVYPKIAQSAHVTGTVVIAATITKGGTLTGLRVVSGPKMLVQAALDAVRTWRYRPFLLDNQPIEVETTVNVVFNMGQQ